MPEVAGSGLQTVYSSLPKKKLLSSDSLDVTLTFSAPAGSTTANAPLIPHYPVAGKLSLTDANKAVLGTSTVQCAKPPCTQAVTIGIFQQAKDTVLKVPLTLAFAPDATVTPPTGSTFPAASLAPVTAVSITL